MMENKLGLTKARESLSTMVENVQYQGDTYIISRHGRPAAALVPIQVYQKWKKQRQEFFDLIKEFQNVSGDTDPDEIMRDVLEAQQAIRSKNSKGL